MRSYLGSASERSLLLLDGLVLFWAVFWIVMGVGVGYSVWQFAAVGDTLVQSGRALDSAGQALRDLGRLPLVGDRSDELGRQVQQTGTEVVQRGQETRTNLQRLGVLLGVAVALVPVTSMAAGYLPGRFRRHRDRYGIRRALEREPADPVLEEYLADRAVNHLSFEKLWSLRFTGDRAPGDEMKRRLADAELARLGIRRPARRS